MRIQVFIRICQTRRHKTGLVDAHGRMLGQQIECIVRFDPRIVELIVAYNRSESNGSRHVAQEGAIRQVEKRLAQIECNDARIGFRRLDKGGKGKVVYDTVLLLSRLDGQHVDRHATIVCRYSKAILVIVAHHKCLGHTPSRTSRPRPTRRPTR